MGLKQCVIGVLEGKEKEGRVLKLPEEIMAENFLNMVKKKKKIYRSEKQS